MENNQQSHKKIKLSRIAAKYLRSSQGIERMLANLKNQFADQLLKNFKKG